MTSATDASPSPGSSIVERAEALRARIATLSQADELAKQVQALRTRADQLDKPAVALEPFTTLRRELEAAGIKVLLPVPLIQGALELARQRRTEFDQDPLSVVADPTDSSFNFDFLMPLQQQIVPSVRQRLSDAWRDHLLAPVAGLDDGLLEVLEKLPALREPVHQLRQGRIELESRASKLPQSAIEVAMGQDASREVRRQWEVLDMSAIPQNVRTFLQAAVTPSGATLAMLDGDVKAWLEERALLGGLRLRFSAGA